MKQPPLCLTRHPKSDRNYEIYSETWTLLFRLFDVRALHGWQVDNLFMLGFWPSGQTLFLIRGFLLGLFLFMQSGCVPVPALRDTASQQEIGEVMKRLAAIRDLKFKEDVSIVMEKKEEIRKHIDAILLENYGEEKLKNMSLAYAKLGLLPAGIDLKRTLLNLYSEQAVGLYNPKAKKIILEQESSRGILSQGGDYIESALNETGIVHELTHALQDQNFPLATRLGPSDNDDRALAFRSIAEGDAVLTELAFFIERLDETALANIREVVQVDSAELRRVLADAPAAIADRLHFSYAAATALVHRLFKEKSWLGINLLYRFPPLSTEQVLHPEKYFDLPDPPTKVQLKDLSALFPSGWTEIENNTLGELMVQCLFKEFFSEEEAKVVANGWDGDRFVAFQRGDEVSFIWATVWDSPQDAEEFYQKYKGILSNKDNSSRFSRAHFHIEKRDHVVVVVEGLESSHIKKNIEKVFLEIELKEEPFESPVLTAAPNDYLDSISSPR